VGAAVCKDGATRVLLVTSPNRLAENSLMRLTALAAAAALALALVPVTAAAGGPSDDHLYRIPFHAGTVDPPRDLDALDPAAHDLVLVQWQDFGDSEVVHALARTGARLVQPLAPVNYLVWADAAQTRAIRDRPGSGSRVCSRTSCGLGPAWTMPPRACV
jgi:hypothetical protein